MNSWKTTACGVIAILTAVLSAVKAMIDGDPATVADWGAVSAAVIAGAGLIFARDNSKSSEDAGAK